MSSLVSLPTGNVFADQVKIFFVQQLLLVTLSPPALLLLSLLAVFWVLAFVFVFIFVYNEAFANLYISVSFTHARQQHGCRCA